MALKELWARVIGQTHRSSSLPKTTRTFVQHIVGKINSLEIPGTMDNNRPMQPGLHAGDDIALLAPKGAIRRKGSLKVLNWNIQHGNESSGDAKTDDNSFCKILREGLIFCLQETKTEINITDYLCFNQPRTDSDSGGLCIGIHKTFAKNCKVINTQYSDI